MKRRLPEKRGLLEDDDLRVGEGGDFMFYI